MLVQKYFNATEASEYLNLHKPKFYALLAQKKIEPVMMSGRIKFYWINDLKKLKRELCNGE